MKNWTIVLISLFLFSCSGKFVDQPSTEQLAMETFAKFKSGWSYELLVEDFPLTSSKKKEVNLIQLMMRVYDEALGPIEKISSVKKLKEKDKTAPKNIITQCVEIKGKCARGLFTAKIRIADINSGWHLYFIDVKSPAITEFDAQADKAANEVVRQIFIDSSVENAVALVDESQLKSLNSKKFRELFEMVKSQCGNFKKIAKESKFNMVLEGDDLIAQKKFKLEFEKRNLLFTVTIIRRGESWKLIGYEYEESKT